MEEDEIHVVDYLTSNLPDFFILNHIYMPIEVWFNIVLAD